MSKIQRICFLLLFLMAFQLCACKETRANTSSSSETLVNPVDGLSWGMTQDEALAALPESCSFKDTNTMGQRTVTTVEGFTGTLFNHTVNPEKECFLRLEFRQPLSYEGVTHEPVLENLTAWVACDDIDKLKEAVSQAMGKPVYEAEGGLGGVGPTNLEAAYTFVWQPTGSGIQQYGEEVECLAAAMYGIYYGGNFPDGGDLTNITTIEELGELNLKNTEEVRKQAAYEAARAGQIEVYDYTELKGIAVIKMKAGLPVMAEAAESHLK